jgi:urea transport system substrate-binding protein
MTLDRRSLLKGAAAASAAVFIPDVTLAADAIKVGSIIDTSGIFDLYGKPMDKAVTLAIEEINAAGGLVGRQLQKVAYDTQSDMALYTQFAKELTRKDKVDVVHGGILSASREAIRPTLRKSKTLYFYNVQYEGGVCDRNIFCTGITPAQQAEILVPETVSRWGKKIYTLAADYNYGQITAKWIQHYAEKAGGQVIQTDFFPLDVADFGATIAKIQEAKPDMIMSVLVGGAHLSFYRQWAAAGMNKKIPMASTTLGAGNEQVVLTKEEGNGIMLVYSFSKELDTPENQAFLAKWAKRFGTTDDLHELAVATYQGMHMWAEGVRKAGSVERMKVIEALESGVSFNGPTGEISLDANTHHAITSVHLVEVRDQKMNVVKSFGERQPVDTQTVCDLSANPNDNKQYEISI